MEIIDKLISGLRGNMIVTVMFIGLLLYITYILDNPKKGTELPNMITKGIGDGIEKFMRWIDRL